MEIGRVGTLPIEVCAIYKAIAAWNVGQKGEKSVIFNLLRRGKEHILVLYGLFNESKSSDACIGEIILLGRRVKEEK